MVENEEKKKQRGPDFIAMYQRYKQLNEKDKGLQAELRRVPEPDDLRDTVTLYRLFHEARPCDNWLRVVFLFPWCEHKEKTPSFGTTLANHGINEKRVLQVARSKESFDIIQLRRLAMQVKPLVDWAEFGWTLWKWDHEKKRKIVEDYFYKTTYKTKKGA